MTVDADDACTEDAKDVPAPPRCFAPLRNLMRAVSSLADAATSLLFWTSKVCFF